ncbi:MAG: hypothetical protein IKP28_04630 [Clostridia bacterium]|nr:hypothetical protein [Clostridia bacterium]
MKKFLEEICNINCRIMNIVNRGLFFSFFIGIIGILLLLTYNTYSVSYDFFDGGIILIRTSILFGTDFFICGFIIDKIIKGKM